MLNCAMPDHFSFVSAHDIIWAFRERESARARGRERERARARARERERENERERAREKERKRDPERWTCRWGVVQTSDWLRDHFCLASA
jgi:hypothetical protein